MTYEEFKNEVLGKGFDADKHYGEQCWDGFAYYCQRLGYPVINCTNTKYARDLWEQRSTNGILNNFDEVTMMQAGDVAIFKVHPMTPLSHVAIFDHDIDGVNGAFLGQNQGGEVVSPNGGSAFNIITLPYSATYNTAFRPKCFAQNPPIEQESTKAPEKGAEGSVYRLYNPNNGDHLYTTDFSEAAGVYMSGWSYEGIAWVAPASGYPVFRLYDGKFHLFTADQEEKNALLTAGGWTNEGIAFRSNGSNRIYRMYNLGSGEHLLTPDRAEHDALTICGWQCEGFIYEN